MDADEENAEDVDDSELPAELRMNEYDDDEDEGMNGMEDFDGEDDIAVNAMKTNIRAVRNGTLTMHLFLFTLPNR